MRLLSCDLLQASFIPTTEMQALRDLARNRQDLMERGADSLNRIQKMMAMMNLQLGSVISDISGKSGMSIITAIVNGERNPSKLAALADDRCKHTKEEIARALHGTYSETPLFIMGQELETYRFYHKTVMLTELKIKELLERLPNKAELETLSERTKKRKEKKEYNQSPYCFDLRSLLYQKFSYDLTVLPGIEESTAATITFEVGGNVDAFPTKRHFSSWAALCPGNKVSGGKMLSGRAPKKFSRVGQALRVAAHANYCSDNSTGAYLRRQVRRGKCKKSARKATAHRLGMQVYDMIKYGQEYVEKSAQDYEQAFEERKLLVMERTLKAAGYEVIKKDHIDEGLSVAIEDKSINKS
jgi:transposase